MNDLNQELKQIRSKKFSESFTQTILNSCVYEFENKLIQTCPKDVGIDFREIYTQTVILQYRNSSSQTDEINNGEESLNKTKDIFKRIENRNAEKSASDISLVKNDFDIEQITVEPNEINAQLRRNSFKELSTNKMNKRLSSSANSSISSFRNISFNDTEGLRELNELFSVNTYKKPAFIRENQSLSNLHQTVINSASNTENVPTKAKKRVRFSDILNQENSKNS